jgi:hypothetical protein
MVNVWLKTAESRQRFGGGTEFLKRRLPVGLTDQYQISRCRLQIVREYAAS